MRRDTARTRNTLLDTVGALLAERGLGFSLPDLARASGVGTATVYRHFDDVQDAHRDFYYRLMDELVDQLGSLPGEGLERFRLTCDRWVRLALEWGRAATHIRSAGGFLERVAADDPPTSALFNALAPAFDDLVARGAVPEQDRNFAILMWITVFDERVIIDLAQHGWSRNRIARTLGASLTGIWMRSELERPTEDAPGS